ncbi:class I SAM-dependent methyltransferase [Vreelandella subglaciescola]|jgi:16S rRNA (guanine1207-N2)-methyltransferase|uniref:16S rRNA m(2)G 1207 methyltransferase n=1 Tax=Vreelandella subglaciescola TaxID=29571 RepID=A0A1M7FCI1_9GAMM|nr:class I SAM-dependent methyltransferase [Halomonas subglaciescola]SHM01792.1 16S rRNA m(2)G 1207 methyltransferase [Halomonas subglaciescola]
MSAQTPSCQLLERDAFSKDPDFASFWAIAPPDDPWLLSAAAGVVSADQALHERFAAQSTPVVSPLDEATEAKLRGGTIHAVVLFWPKALRLGGWWLDWLNQTLPDGTPVAVVGEHQGGIRRVPKWLAERGLECDKRDGARRCSVFVTQTRAPDALPAERLASQAWERFTARDMQMVSHPGVFGHGKVDEGTTLLLDTLEGALGDTPLKVLDVGCGDGIISAWLARQGHNVSAVDVNHFAVEACRRTLAENGADGCVLASDVYSALGDERFDLIISNPPFHQEREIDYGAAGRLIAEASGHLTKGGKLVLVANAFLPYAVPLERAFGTFDVLADNRRFKVYRACIARYALF